MPEMSLWSQIEDNEWEAQCFSCEEPIPPKTKFVCLKVDDGAGDRVELEVVICKTCVVRWQRELEEPT